MTVAVYPAAYLVDVVMAVLSLADYRAAVVVTAACLVEDLVEYVLMAAPSLADCHAVDVMVVAYRVVHLADAVMAVLSLVDYRAAVVTVVV